MENDNDRQTDAIERSHIKYGRILTEGVEKYEDVELFDLMLVSSFQGAMLASSDNELDKYMSQIRALLCHMYSRRKLIEAETARKLREVPRCVIIDDDLENLAIRV